MCPTQRYLGLSDGKMCVLQGWVDDLLPDLSWQNISVRLACAFDVVVKYRCLMKDLALPKRSHLIEESQNLLFAADLHMVLISAFSTLRVAENRCIEPKVQQQGLYVASQPMAACRIVNL